MAVPVRGDSLKAYRKRKGLTISALAEKAGVGIATIKRIEKMKDGTHPAREIVAQRLMAELGVKLTELAVAPPPEREKDDLLKKMGYRQVRVTLDAETALAFQTVEYLFGISVKSQMEMAPLFTALLAEGSLFWRRQRVAEIEQAASHLSSLGGGHLAFAAAGYRAEEGAKDERASIASRDLFGQHVGEEAFNFGFDPSINNPFADYLKAFGRDIEATTVAIGDGPDWKTVEGLPEYRIGEDLIGTVTGGNSDAEYALLRGHVRLKEIPLSLLGDEKEADRVAWIIARIPEQELAERKVVSEAVWKELLGENLPRSSDGGGDDA